MEKIKPLARFPVISTSRVEEAEFCIRQSIADAMVDRVDERRNFRFELNAVHFKRSSLLYNCFGTETKLRASCDSDLALFITGMGIPITLKMDNEWHLVTQHKAVILSSDKRVRIQRPAHSEILYLRFSLSDLWNHLAEITARHHRGPLIFDRQISVVKGSGAILQGLMHYLVNLFECNDAVIKLPAITKSFNELLMTTMLSLPHNKMDQLYEDRSSMVAPAIVYRAEEYMRAHLTKPITISDLLRVSDCSRSVLFAAFRNTRNYTPMEFLTEQRLHLAREQLLYSKQKASVSSIAMNSGFISNSWFSQVYRKRFGERPSDTLRRRK